MKYRDPTTGDFKTIKIRATDELPVGSEIDVDDNTEIPVGWEETDDFNSYSTTEKKIGTWINRKADISKSCCSYYKCRNWTNRY